MHIADPTIGIFGANGIVGAGLPIAAGAATAAQLRHDGSVAVAFFGDGAVAHGTFHEAINLAAVWQLPVIFFCENNGYAEFSPASAQHAAPLERRAAGYGVDYVAVDGNDVVATAAAMTSAIEAARARTRSRRRRGRHLPLARSLRRRPAALPVARRGRGVGGTRPADRQRAAAPSGRHRRRRARIHAVIGRARARRRRRGGPPIDRAGRSHADRLRHASPGNRACRAAAAGRRCAGVPHDGRDPRRARSGARRRRARVRRRDRRRRGRQRVRPHARPARSLRRSGARHADLRERDRRPRRRRRDGRHATRWSS